jgi:hypothetical protein
MGDNNVEIKKLKTSPLEGLVKRYPYTLLIRCWSLMRMAEENWPDFFDEYGGYITGTGETMEEMSFFEEIPLTDDGKYLLNLVVEDFMVRDFCILRNPPFEKYKP